MQNFLDYNMVVDIYDYAVADLAFAEQICYRATNVAAKGNSSQGGYQSSRAAAEMQLMFRGIARVFNVSMREIWIVFAKMGMRMCVDCKKPEKHVGIGRLVCVAGGQCTAPSDMIEVLSRMEFKT